MAQSHRDSFVGDEAVEEAVSIAKPQTESLQGQGQIDGTRHGCHASEDEINVERGMAEEVGRYFDPSTGRPH